MPKLSILLGIYPEVKLLDHMGLFLCFPDGSVVKNSPANGGDAGEVD